MTDKFCRYFGLSDGYWLRAQAACDTEVARREMAEVLRGIRPFDGQAA
jgi:plasmid maintenance system antidote protein VapI